MLWGWHWVLFPCSALLHASYRSKPAPQNTFTLRKLRYTARCFDHPNPQAR